MMSRSIWKHIVSFASGYGSSHIPALAPSNGEQGEGTERQTSTQQGGEDGCSDPHDAGHVKRLCHTTLPPPCFARTPCRYLRMPRSRWPRDRTCSSPCVSSGYPCQSRLVP